LLVPVFVGEGVVVLVSAGRGVPFSTVFVVPPAGFLGLAAAGEVFEAGEAEDFGDEVVAAGFLPPLFLYSFALASACFFSFV